MLKISEKLNFLFIFTDQQRTDHLSCYNNKMVLKTPNIDLIANEGIKFTNFYCNNPICMPNRSTIFTGQYPSVHGVTTNGRNLPEKTRTFVDIFLESGLYHTASFGKIHYNLKFFANLERWNAIIVYEPYVYAFTKYTNPNITLEHVLGNPVESMAELILSFWYIYDLETRVQKLKETVRDWKIDGVILHNNMSCRPNACGMYDLKRKLMEEANIPCLILDADMNDPRKFHELQTLNKIESFIEILKERKKS